MSEPSTRSTSAGFEPTDLITGQKQVNESEVFFNFINSIKSEATKEVYHNNIKLFMKFYGLSKMSDLLALDVQNSIIKYVMSMREKGLSSNSIQGRLNAIFHFYSMNDVVLNKKKKRCSKVSFQENQ
jgi:site-specific recombinase XerC